MPSTVMLEMSKDGLEVLLRLPALFLLDMWFRKEPTRLKTFDDHEITVKVFYYSVFFLVVALEILPIKRLETLYLSAVSCFLIFLSHILSLMFVTAEKKENKFYNMYNLFTQDGLLDWILLQLISHCVIATIVSYLLGIKNWFKYFLLVYTMPVFARLAGYNPNQISEIHTFASVFTLLLIVLYIFDCLSNIIDICKECLNETQLISLPVQMLIFGLFTFFSNVYMLGKIENIGFISSENRTIDERWLVIILMSFKKFCISPTNIFVFFVMIYYMYIGVLNLTKLCLLNIETIPFKVYRHSTWSERFLLIVLFYIFYILDSSTFERTFFLSTLLLFFVSVLIHPVHEIVDSVLLKLSISHNKSSIKHGSAIVLCLFLGICSLLIFYFQYQYMYYVLDSDLFRVTVQILLILPVKVIGSLVVYVLFMQSSFGTKPWKTLHYEIYWVGVVEFVVNVCLACYVCKFYELDFLNIFQLHTLFTVLFWFLIVYDIICDWKKFLLRWTTLNKVDSLLLATRKQLRYYSDVCAICSKEMNSARITDCDCLRKWLFITETCPLCHQELLRSRDTSSNESVIYVDDGDGRNEPGNVNQFDLSTDQSDMGSD